MPDTIFERQGIVMKAEQDFSVSEWEAKRKKKKSGSREKKRESEDCMRKT